MPPALKKLTGHIGFGLCVCASIGPRTVHARILKFHIWIPHGKIFDTRFFLVQVMSLSGVMPFEKIWMTSDACHILWTMHARVLKFLMWIPHGKIADTYLFLVWVISLSGVTPFEKIRMKSCQQDISKSIWARGLKLGQLIGDDK